MVPIRDLIFSFSLHRVKSRAVIINFSSPGIGPSNQEEEKTRMELEGLINTGDMTVLIGWAIAQGKSLTSADGIRELLQSKEALRGLYQGRCCQNWALLLFFLKRVSSIQTYM